MSAQLNESCRTLPLEELHKVISHLWPRVDGVATINYTFDTRLIPQNVIESARQDLNQKRFDPLNDISQLVLSMVLDAWTKACKSKVNFKYVGSPSEDFSGIIISNCDNLKSALGYWEPIQRNSLGYMKQGIVCIPSQYFQRENFLILKNVHTISHEIGHAIGIQHLHEFPLIKTHLQDTEQGMGCSVMPYSHEILKDPINYCRDQSVCLNHTSAVLPGPLDQDVCQLMYGENSRYFPKQVSLGEVITSYGIEGMRVGYLTAVKEIFAGLLQQNGASKLQARVKTDVLILSIVLSKSVILSMTEGVSQTDIYNELSYFLIPLGCELSSITLELVSDFLKEKNYPIIGDVVNAGASSLSRIVFGYNLVRSCISIKSTTQALATGVGLVSSFFSYAGAKYCGNLFFGLGKNQNKTEIMPEEESHLSI